MEFAFVGCTVNVASRVQQLTRQFPADIIIREAVQQTLAPRFALRPLPPTAVRGVEQPLLIYAIELSGA